MISRRHIGFMRSTGLSCAGAIAAFMSGAAVFAQDATNAAPPPANFDLGFIATRDTTLYGETRLRFLGPLFESKTAADGSRFDALRPFFSKSTGRNGRDFRLDFFWPFATTRRTGDQESTRVLSTYYTDFDVNDPESRYRFWILPFFFNGRDLHGETYAAVFPFLGQVNEFLTMDRVQFVMFPFLTRYYKMGHETWDMFWPFLSYSRSKDTFGVRVLPLYGRYEKEGTSARDFFLWPLWTYGRDYRPPGGHGYILFPLFGHTRRGEFESFTLLPPVIRWSVGPKQKELSMPWPFFQYGKGKVNRFYLWPFVGAKDEAGLRTSFMFWPILTTWFRDLPDRTDHRFMILPFVQYHSKRLKSREDPRKRGEVLDRTLKLWPVLSYKETGEISRTRIPDIWPFLTSATMDNNYGPMWTFFTHVKKGNCIQDELLWGLFRSSTTENGSKVSLFPLVSWETSRENPDLRSWSFLLGLLGRERRDDNVTVRMLYFIKIHGKAPPGGG